MLKGINTTRSDKKTGSSQFGRYFQCEVYRRQRYRVHLINHGGYSAYDIIYFGTWSYWCRMGPGLGSISQRVYELTFKTCDTSVCFTSYPSDALIPWINRLSFVACVMSDVIRLDYYVCCKRNSYFSHNYNYELLNALWYSSLASSTTTNISFVAMNNMRLFCLVNVFVCVSFPT